MKNLEEPKQTPDPKGSENITPPPKKDEKSFTALLGDFWGFVKKLPNAIRVVTINLLYVIKAILTYPFKAFWKFITYLFKAFSSFSKNAKENLFVIKRHPFRFIDAPNAADTPSNTNTPNAADTASAANSIDSTNKDDKGEEKPQSRLDAEGFITLEDRKRLGIKEDSIIAQDLKALEKHLLPHFWHLDYKAKYYQNVFYNHQWSFILGAFFTTVSAIITSNLSQVEGNGTITIIVCLLKVITVGMSGWATYATFMSNHFQPRKRWINCRRLAEELRMTYYKYLTHIEPFANVSDEKRLDELRRHVVEIQKKEKASNG